MASAVTAPPEPLVEFIRLFNRAEFWESHEVLEEPWRERRSGFYKGMILFASAFVHAQRGNVHGIVAQMAKATRELEPYRPAYLGIDVEHVLEVAGVAAAHAAAESGAGRPAPSIDFPRLRADPALVRGDEAELTV